MRFAFAEKELHESFAESGDGQLRAPPGWGGG